MSLDTEAWKAFQPKLRIMRHTLKKHEVLYMPVGWMLAERTCAGP